MLNAHRSSRPPSAWRVLVATLATLLALAGATVPAGAAPTEAPAAFRFSGGGYGHGVGMSQFGALGRAEAGQTAAEILAAYYPTTTVAPYDVPKNLRVHLASSASARLDPSGPVTLLGLGGGPRRGVQGPITISRLDGRFVVTDGSGADLCTSSRRGTDRCTGSVIRVRFAQGRPVGLSAGSFANRYRWGRFAFNASSSGLTVVLERLSMDRYLYGLAEMPASWPDAALDSQAIAGRSYATASVLARRADPSWTRPYDLESGQQDQVYQGLPNEEGTYGPLWVAAVDRTSGQVVLGDGGSTVVQAFYSSSNGGYTETSEYVFYASYPWFAATPDPFDAVEGNWLASWERTYTQDQMARWFDRSSIGSVGAVLDIEVGGWVGASGRIDKADVTVTGSERTVTISGNTLIAVVNNGAWSEGGDVNDIVPSSKVEVRVAGIAPQGELDRVVTSDGLVRVVGWAHDADAGRKVTINVTVNGTTAATGSTGVRRPDIAVALGIGRRTGFRVPVTIAAGSNEICAYAVDNGDEPDTLLGCQTVVR